MAKIKGKKGIFFTFLAILIVGVMLFYFTSQSYVTQKDDLSTIKSRVQIANNYAENLRNTYLERAILTSSISSLTAMTYYSNYTSDYFDDVDDLNTRFKEIMVNGTIDSKEIDSYYQKFIMKDNTLEYELELLENASLKILKINTTFDKDFDNIDVIIYQDNNTGPWQVGVNVTISYEIDAGIAQWSKKDIIPLKLSIFELDDPLYYVNTTGNYTNKIRRSPHTEWNLTTLTYHVGNMTYKYEPTAPSFLMRYTYNLTNSSCCGIESPILPGALGLENTIVDKSYIDWCFFSDQCAPDQPGDFWNITGLTSTTPGNEYYYFVLDSDHVVWYNVTDEATHTP